VGTTAAGRRFVTGFDGMAVAVAIAAATTDLRSGRIPNALTGPAMLGALVAHSAMPGGAGLWPSVGGLVGGLAVFFPFFALRGLGGGDVKLMGALGAWVGWPAVVWVALFTALSGGVIALGLALRRGYLREAGANLAMLVRSWLTMGPHVTPSLTLEHGRGPRLPYAVPTLAGLVISLWLQ